MTISCLPLPAQYNSFSLHFSPKKPQPKPNISTIHWTHSLSIQTPLKNLKCESCSSPAGSNLRGSPEGTSPEILVLAGACWKQQGGIALKRWSGRRNRLSYSLLDVLSYACSLQPHKHILQHMEKCPNMISCSDLETIGQESWTRTGRCRALPEIRP